MTVSTGRGVRVGVVGGGILGVSTAAHLARRRAEVTLLSDGRLAGGASGRSLSWLNSFGPRSSAYHRLRLRGLDRYRDLDRAGGHARWLRFDGGLTWAAPDAVQGHRDAFRHMVDVGYPAEWLARDEVAARVPGVDVRAIPDAGAVLNPDEGWVDLPALVDHLARDVVRHGGRITTGAGPARVVLRGHRVGAVRTASGHATEVDVAVLATGPAVPATVAELGVHLPDATTPALLVRTRPVATELRAVLNTPRVAVRPAPDGGLAIDAGWAEREVERGPDGTWVVHDSTVRGLLHEASAVLAGHPELPLASFAAGPKPIPGDGEPVLGELAEVPGLHVAFSHSGATLGLVVGELLADEIVTGRPSPELADFRPGRFA